MQQESHKLGQSSKEDWWDEDGFSEGFRPWLHRGRATSISERNGENKWCRCVSSLSIYAWKFLATNCCHRERSRIVWYMRCPTLRCYTLPFLCDCWTYLASVWPGHWSRFRLWISILLSTCRPIFDRYFQLRSIICCAVGSEKDSATQ